MSAINRDVLEVQAEATSQLCRERATKALAPAPARPCSTGGRLKADGDADQALGMAEVEQVLAAPPRSGSAASTSIQGRQLAHQEAPS
ncbi:hypothetical protein [Pseudomonas aeruginosa]|uniref:hypothetical protein n=1 Tax=Pseudomonas aeruginosa TaxID=287 RepID=UPI003D9C2633